MIIVITANNRDNTIEIYNMSKTEFTFYKRNKKVPSVKCYYNIYYLNIHFIGLHKKLMYDAFNNMISFKIVNSLNRSESVYNIKNKCTIYLCYINKFNATYTIDNSFYDKISGIDKQISCFNYISEIYFDDINRHFSIN